LLTTYPSEPSLADAEFRLSFAKGVTEDKIVSSILNVVAEEVEKGDYDVGGNGGLVARLLCNCLS